MLELPTAARETIDAHDQLEDALTSLDRVLRAGDGGTARLQLSMIEAAFEEYVSGEERVVFPVIERLTRMKVTPTIRMRREHAGLRTLVASLRDALERADHATGIRVLGTLRSVYLLHMAKEEWVLHGLLARP